jgi:FKBP-type peptidyl-prolyl cis-trans isomerase SlyD
MHDAQGEPLSAPVTLTYLHGGYGGLLEALERALESAQAGDKVQVQLEPEQAFGEYDETLLRVEPAQRYGEGLQAGMEIEDSFEGAEPRMYTVTDVAGGMVVLDANHALAGMALRFALEVTSVRAPSAEEIRRGVSSP